MSPTKQFQRYPKWTLQKKSKLTECLSTVQVFYIGNHLTNIIVFGILQYLNKLICLQNYQIISIKIQTEIPNPCPSAHLRHSFCAQPSAQQVMNVSGNWAQYHLLKASFRIVCVAVQATYMEQSQQFMEISLKR